MEGNARRNKTMLFLYGTLKSGMKMNHLLAGQTCIGPAETVARYRLYQLDWYPAIVRDDSNGLAVQGELWEVDETTLARLDEFEGATDLFARESIAVQHHFGPVQAYFYNRPIPAGTPSGDRWPLPN
jgi:gamma-glutamylcyclotransferase (GGCT)/AIG2-like uncharacterized protein YtfP